MKKTIICLILVLLIVTGCKIKNSNIPNSAELYDVAIEYLIDNNSDPDRNNNRYKLFIDYHGFGIYKDSNYRYAYMWISDESYYVVDNKIVSGSGGSMPYKFTFELDSNKVVKYEIPDDGSEYVPSIKRMFPDDIENKVLDYEWDSSKLMKEVKEYYSDLEDKDIYFEIDDELVKSDY